MVWIWATTSGGKLWLCLRGPGRPLSCISVPLALERIEVVELACGADPGDVLRVDVVEACQLDEPLDLEDVLVGEVFDAGVGAERADPPGHVDHRLVQRVAEGLAGVTADEDGPRLGHEPAHVTDVASHDDRAALERDPSPRAGVSRDRNHTAVGGRAGGLGGVAVDADRARHEVLADPPADEAVDGDVGTVAESADVVAGVAVDGDVEVVAQPDGEVVAAPRLGDA